MSSENMEKAGKTDKADKNELFVKPRKQPYGIRSPKTLEIWPLSIGDQDALAQRIDGSIKEFFNREAKEGMAADADFAVFVMKVLRENIGIILQITTGKTEDEVGMILADMTNKQARAVINAVWEENYADLVKNLSGLFAMVAPAVVGAATD